MRFGPGGVSFHDQIFHQGLSLQVRSREENGEAVYEIPLPAGTKFTPERHMNYSAVIKILSGRGLIVVGSIARRYEEGNVFSVPMNVAHGFVQVDEETVYELYVTFVQANIAAA